MSLALSSKPLNKLLAWSMGNGGEGYVRIEFPFNLAWYHEQPSTKFRSFQHRKEYGGLYHEFIVLNMTDRSVCRVERIGDPNARIHALTFQGSVAYDMAQSFRPDDLAKAGLDTSSIVSEVHLPSELDLKDVLNICRAIQEAGRTRKYTFETFNCYFFSLALQSCLTRLVADWENEIPYEAWKSAASVTSDSVPSIDQGTHPLFRIHSMLYPRSSPWATQRFLESIQQHFRKEILGLGWEDVVNGVFWYHELEATLDGSIEEGLRTAWWKAAAPLIDPGELKSRGTSSSNNESETLAHQCISALWHIVKLSGGFGTHGYVHHKPRRLMSNMHKSQSSQPEVQVSNNEFDHLDLMDYRSPVSDELEQVKALTITQWLVILRLHAKQIVSHMFGLFVSLSTMLVWIPLLSYKRDSQPTYIDAELARVALILGPSGDVEKNQLVALLKRLRSINTRTAVWEEYPWAPVLGVIKKRSPSNLPLGEESAVITAFLEGQGISSITVSAFQQHIIRRIKLQAQLVERVGLASAVKVSSEIQLRLSLVWATIRNDDFDACEMAPGGAADDTGDMADSGSSSTSMHTPEGFMIDRPGSTASFLPQHPAPEGFVRPLVNVADTSHTSPYGSHHHLLGPILGIWYPSSFVKDAGWLDSPNRENDVLQHVFCWSLSEYKGSGLNFIWSVCWSFHSEPTLALCQRFQEHGSYPVQVNGYVFDASSPDCRAMWKEIMPPSIFSPSLVGVTLYPSIQPNWFSSRDTSSDISVDACSPEDFEAEPVQGSKAYFCKDTRGNIILNVPRTLKSRGAVNLFLEQALAQLDKRVQRIKCSLCKNNEADRMWGVKPSNLQRHILGHLGIKDHHCFGCGEKFTTKDQMIKHMKKKHPVLPEWWELTQKTQDGGNRGAKNENVA